MNQNLLHYFVQKCGLTHLYNSSIFRALFTRSKMIPNAQPIYNTLKVSIFLLFMLTSANSFCVDISDAQNVSAHIGEALVITSTGTLTTDGATQSVGSITINAGGKLCIQSGHALTITGNLVLEASAANVSFRYLNSGTISVGGTVTYVKTINDASWYYLAFPSNVDIATQVVASSGTIGTNWFVKSYNGDARADNGGASSNWTSVTSGTLTGKQGHIYGLQTGHNGGSITLTFTLNSSVLTETATVPVADNTGTADVVHHGWNLIGAPYLSNYDGDLGGGVNITAANAKVLNFLTIPCACSYTQIAKADADLIPFTAFFAQIQSGTGTVNYAATGRYLTRFSTKDESVMDDVKLIVSTSTGDDNTHLYIDPAESPTYQIGNDLQKFAATGTPKPQINSVLNGVNYAFNALPLENVQNLPLSIYTQTAGTATISCNMAAAPGISRLLLTDNTANVTTDLMVSDYVYNALAGTESARFTISAEAITTDSESAAGENILLMVNKSVLQIENLLSNSIVTVYDVMGNRVACVRSRSSSLDVLLPNKGIYMVEIVQASSKLTRKVLCK